MAARPSPPSSAGGCWHSVAGASIGLNLLERYEAVMKVHHCCRKRVPCSPPYHATCDSAPPHSGDRRRREDGDDARVVPSAYGIQNGESRQWVMKRSRGHVGRSGADRPRSHVPGLNGWIAYFLFTRCATRRAIGLRLS
jgi:hypothetical protein